MRRWDKFERCSARIQLEDQVLWPRLSAVSEGSWREISFGVAAGSRVGSVKVRVRDGAAASKLASFRSLNHGSYTAPSRSLCESSAGC